MQWKMFESEQAEKTIKFRQLVALNGKSDVLLSKGKVISHCLYILADLFHLPLEISRLRTPFFLHARHDSDVDEESLCVKSQCNCQRCS